MHRQMQFFAEFCKCRRFVLLFDIIQRCHCDHVFILIRQAHLRILYRFQKIEENQSHRCLVDPILIAFTGHKRVDHIFKKILDLQHFCDLKMQIFSTLFILAQHINQEICKDIIIPRHRIGHIKKLWKDHKVDCNIFFPRRQNLMSRILVQKQQFACMDHDFFTTYNICKLSLADIKHLNIIMPVRWKMHKSCMGTYSDQFALTEHFRTVHREILPRCIKVLIYLCNPIQDSLFFFCYNS